jgi:hypothetical protein
VAAFKGSNPQSSIDIIRINILNQSQSCTIMFSLSQ